MAKIREILGELDVKSLEITKENVRKPSIGSDLINNLLVRLNKMGNTMIEMSGFFVKRVRVSLPTKSTSPTDTPFVMHLWVKPFPQGKYLMLKILEPKILNGHVIRASDIFGNSINCV